MRSLCMYIVIYKRPSLRKVAGTRLCRRTSVDAYWVTVLCKMCETPGKPPAHPSPTKFCTTRDVTSLFHSKHSILIAAALAKLLLQLRTVYNPDSRAHGAAEALPAVYTRLDTLPKGVAIRPTPKY